MPWERPWQWTDPGASGKTGKTPGKRVFTELEKLPWACTKLGCSKKDNWNYFHTCKDCGAPRTTPPFTTMPGEKAAVDWEAKYKALEAKQKKDKEKEPNVPEPEEKKPTDSDDTDTESDTETPDTLTQDLDQLIKKFEKLNTSKCPELAVLKQLVAAKKQCEGTILTDAEIEQNITKTQKEMDALTQAMKGMEDGLRQLKENTAITEAKLQETKTEYETLAQKKEKWLTERLERHAESQKNQDTKEPPWEKQAHQQKKEKKQAQRRKEQLRQKFAGRLPELLDFLTELTKEDKPGDEKQETPGTDSDSDVHMEDSEAVKKRKARNLARKAEEKRRKQNEEGGAASANTAGGSSQGSAPAA